MVKEKQSIFQPQGLQGRESYSFPGIPYCIMYSICQHVSDNHDYPTSTGKERDSETGFSYFGARYYDSDILTGWLSVDPMADKYPSLSPYAYCAWNPVKLVDPDGEEISPIFSTEGKLLGTDDEGYEGRAIVMEKEKFKQGMSHEEAQKSGQFLDRYGKGISISESDWNKVVENGGKRLIPTVSNESDHTIYYKPEGIKDGENMNPNYSSSGAFSIPAHTDLYASADGIAAPHIKRGEVFKMPDGLKISVTNQTIRRNISSSHPISFGLSYISYFGGWKGNFWHNYIRANCISIPTVSFSVDVSKHADRSWDKLFKSSR